MKIMGHRGARNEAPENTLAGFAHLRQLGIHCVELDLQLSKDQQLVVIHDPSLERTAKLQGNVADYTAKELAQMDARCTFPQWPEITSIPTIESVLSAWPELEKVQLEIKTRPSSEYAQVIHLLDNLIGQFNLEDKATITSSDQAFLQSSIRDLSNQNHGYIAEANTLSPLSISLALGCKELIAHYSLCNEALITNARKNHIKLSAWTVNDVSEMIRLEKLAIDFLITDVPSLAAQALLLS